VIFFTSGLNSGATRAVTDYVNSTRTFTFSPALASVITAADQYVVIADNYNRGDLLQAVNQALIEVGRLTQHNDTLVVLADTEEYTLPAGVYNVVDVEEAANAATPYSWERNHYWKENAGKLIFAPGKEPDGTGNLIRVWYNAAHAAVSADADTISDAINPMRLAAASAYYAAYNRARVVEQDDPVLKDVLQLTANLKKQAEMEHPIRNTPKQPRYALW
jgi:hypothetical protein